jgi:hypothetical protein
VEVAGLEIDIGVVPGEDARLSVPKVTDSWELAIASERLDSPSILTRDANSSSHDRLLLSAVAVELSPSNSERLDHESGTSLTGADGTLDGCEPVVLRELGTLTSGDCAGSVEERPDGVSGISWGLVGCFPKNSAKSPEVKKSDC